MSWVDRLRVRVIEALGGSAFGSTGPDDDRELAGFRRLTDERRMRDLDLLSHEQMLKVAHYLYDSDPMAGWMIDQRVDVVLGGELGYSVELNPKVLKIEPEEAREVTEQIKRHLDRFWEHPAHNLRLRADEYLTTFMVSGHLLLPISKQNEIDGVPQLDFIDAEQLKGVVPVEGSSLVADVVLVKTSDPNEPKKLKIIRENPKTGALEGETFYYRNSRLLNAMRGRSELMRQADYIDSLNQFLWARVDRANMLNSMVWDLEMTEARAGEIKARVKEVAGTISKPGGIFAHNEKEKLTAKTADLSASDASQEVRVLKNYILGSKSIPESWYGEGGETNRATAGDQTDVAYKSLATWQKRTKGIFNPMLWYAYDQLVAKQQIFPSRAGGGVTITVDLPPISERDVSRLSAALTQVAAGMGAAIADGLVSKGTALKVFLHVVDKLGVAVDPDEEAAAIKAEGEAEDAASAERQANDARAGFEKDLADDPAAEAPADPAAPIDAAGAA